MKKMALAGLAAVCVMALAQQQVSAWTNSRFSVGLNWEHQSGGNNFLWGAFRNGQPPGPEAWGGAGGGYNGGPIMPNYAAPQPYYGGAPTPAPAYAPPAPMKATAEPPYSGGYVSPYQFATYPRQVRSNVETATPTYYYPNTTYYYYYPGYYYYSDR